MPKLPEFRCTVLKPPITSTSTLNPKQDKRPELAYRKPSTLNTGTQTKPSTLSSELSPRNQASTPKPKALDRKPSCEGPLIILFLRLLECNFAVNTRTTQSLILSIKQPETPQGERQRRRSVPLALDRDALQPPRC